MADPLTPVLPPQTSSIAADMPISEIVALTEVNVEAPTPEVNHPLVETPKSPLFEDPDQIKVKGVS